MQVVYKYRLPLIPGPQKVTMPSNAQVVEVAEQSGQPYLWATVDPSAPPQDYTVRIVATGELLPDSWRHLGTVHVRPHVFHVFTDTLLPPSQVRS